MDEIYDPYVWCGTCCLRTRSCDSVAEAITAWNTRAPAPSDQEKLLGELVEALGLASSAIDEMFRYFDGGETRGSYDGKPERAQLRKAGYAIKPVLTRARQAAETVGRG